MLGLELSGGSVGHAAIRAKKSSVLLVIPRVHLTQFGQMIGARKYIKYTSEIGASVARIKPTEFIEWHLHIVTENGHCNGHIDHGIVVSGEEEFVDRFLDGHFGIVHLETNVNQGTLNRRPVFCSGSCGLKTNWLLEVTKLFSFALECLE